MDTTQASAPGRAPTPPTRGATASTSTASSFRTSGTAGFARGVKPRPNRLRGPCGPGADRALADRSVP